MKKGLYVIVDTANPQCTEFVEIEDESGKSVSIDWVEMPNRSESLFAIGPLVRPAGEVS